MSREEIELIVKLTVDELISRGMLKNESYPDILKKVSYKLHCHFKGAAVEGVAEALNSLKNDRYIDVIYMQYRDELTIEKVAEIMNKDTSTIKRNKKRLIKQISEMVEM